MQGKTFSIVKKIMQQHLALYIFLGVIILLTALLASVATPELLRRIVEGIIENRRGYLTSAIMLFAGSVLLGIFLKSLNRTLAFEADKKMVYEMENRFLEHYSKLKYWNLTINPSNALSLFRQSTTGITSDFNAFCFASLQLALSVVFAVVYSMVINWQVLLICIAATGLMMAFSQGGVSKIPAMSEKITNNRNRLYAIAWEHIKNTEVAGLLNTSRTAKGYVDANEEYLSNWLSLKKIYNRSQLFSMFGSKVIILLIAVFGGVMSLYGKVRLSDIFVLVVVIPTISSALFEIPNKIAEYKQFAGKFSVMDGLFNMETEESPREASDPVMLKDLQVTDLSYRYPGQEKKVLDNISFRFSGGLACIAGQSGSGKSTLLRICARLLSYDTGLVLWNGTEVGKYDRTALWVSMSYLDQTPRILPGTLLLNITLARKLPNHEERLERAIADTGLDEFVKKDPNGVEMEIDASKLSNGELQKICFARAFYGKYDVLLLDEATSALDPAVEQSIILALKRRIAEEKILVIAVAHKVKFLENSDEIVLLDNGRVEAAGSHDDLMKTSMQYKKFLCTE